jgi:hypothetical protein
LNETFLGGGGTNNAFLSGVIYKTMPTWSFMSMSALSPGKVFTECEPLVTQNLEKVGFDPIILLETANWKPNSGKKFNIKKEQVINLPSGMNQFKIGLGWDTKMDLDSSILLMGN